MTALSQRSPTDAGVAPRAALDLGQEAEVFSVERVGWLIRLRWFALSGIGIAAALAWAGAFPGVRWIVLRRPVEVSKAQITAFRGIFPMNARPVGPVGARILLAS